LFSAKKIFKRFEITYKGVLKLAANERLSYKNVLHILDTVINNLRDMRLIFLKLNI